MCPWGSGLVSALLENPSVEMFENETAAMLVEMMGCFSAESLV